MVVRMKHKMAAAFAVAIVVFVAVHFVSFPGSVPDFRRASGGGTLLDMTPEFSEDALYARLTGYGAAGRSNYAFRTVTVDVVLPLALLPFLFLWMRSALNRLSLGARPRALLLAIPVLYVVFDLVENGSLLALLGNFPVRMHLLSAVLPYLTIIKRTASMLAILGPLMIVAFVLIRTQWTRRHVAA
jgi:hypothetical protein